MLGTTRLRLGQWTHLGLLLGLWTLSGCHVVERSRECQHLAQAIKSSAAALAPKLPANPSAEALTQRSLAFEKLATALKKVPEKRPELRKARSLVLKQLNVVSTQLLLAAEAVNEGRAAQKLAEEAQAEFDREREQRRAEPLSDKKPRREPAPKNPAHRHRAQQQKALHRYLRAKTEIEAADRKINESMEKLRQSCS